VIQCFVTLRQRIVTVPEEARMRPGNRFRDPGPKQDDGPYGQAPSRRAFTCRVIDLAALLEAIVISKESP